MSNHCRDCGCIMDGGFCTNCHEEVFIACQYAESGDEMPVSIGKKASEHIGNEERIERAKEIRNGEEKKRKEERFALFNE